MLETEAWSKRSIIEVERVYTRLHLATTPWVGVPSRWTTVKWEKKEAARGLSRA